MTVSEKATMYYPEQWGKKKLKQLVVAGKLTEAEYEQITGEAYTAYSWEAVT